MTDKIVLLKRSIFVGSYLINACETCAWDDDICCFDLRWTLTTDASLWWRLYVVIESEISVCKLTLVSVQLELLLRLRFVNVFTINCRFVGTVVRVYFAAWRLINLLTPKFYSAQNDVHDIVVTWRACRADIPTCPLPIIVIFLCQLPIWFRLPSLWKVSITFLGNNTTVMILT